MKWSENRAPPASTMSLTVLAALSLTLAAVPTLLYLINVYLYRPAPAPGADTTAVSVLIPPRNEERSIGPALEAILASRGVEFEVFVLDDHSDDRTAAIVTEFAGRDSRVRLIYAPPLPEGWCGKQHACHVLARHA